MASLAVTSPPAPMTLTPEELEKKREENIRKKEEERKQKVEEIKARKAEKMAVRASEKEKIEQAKAAEEARRRELAEKEKKRAAKIAEIEAERAKKAAENDKKKKEPGGVKYSKRDVMELKEVFDSYDESRDGRVSLREFTASLAKNKKQVSTHQKTTREERRAAEGISLAGGGQDLIALTRVALCTKAIAHVGESIFHELDVDGSGEVTFAELLKLMYPYATATELEVMAGWAAPPEEPEPQPEPGLSETHKAELRLLFRMYDKDQSGSISKAELLQALQQTGLSKTEIKDLFENADTSGDDAINLEEFMELMESTGMYST